MQRGCRNGKPTSDSLLPSHHEPTKHCDRVSQQAAWVIHELNDEIIPSFPYIL